LARVLLLRLVLFLGRTKEAAMKKILFSLVAVIVIALAAPRAEAKLAALYATGQGGVQSTAETAPGLGFELGARVLIVDGYVDYMNFGPSESVTRGILGVRGGLGTEGLRLVLRAGAGAIREEHGALMGDAYAPPSRTGAVARAGGGLDARLDPLFYLGFMVDAETFLFPESGTVAVGATNVPTSYRRGADVFASLRLTFELGI
jgi:hypothetical protein